MKKRVKRLVQKFEGLKDLDVEVRINGHSAWINRAEGRLSIQGDELLAVEAYKILENTENHKISKFNANKYLKARGV